ncbi:MAG: hypothetical protein Q4F65_11875 [Propionibacteriaceae bacterium]|nr:hypothetical protein [Propionibacteriaceae bacterium]
MSQSAVRPTWGTCAIACLLTAAVVAGVWVTLGWRSTPTLLQPDPTATGTLEVSSSDFTDPREVTFTPTLEAGFSVKTVAAGVLTGFTCTPGAEVSSGERIATIDNRPVVVLATASPLWRDLWIGTKGPDVEDLTGELVRLGRLSDDQAGRELTRTAMKAAVELTGRGGEALTYGDALFIPSPTARVGSCEARVGDTLTAGTALLTLTPTIEDLHTTTDLTGSVPGERLVHLAGQSAPLVQGRVTDPAFLQGLLDTGIIPVTGADGSGDPFTLPATVELSVPLEVLSVPAASITVHDSTACVGVDGEATEVQVVSSTLGRTLVTFTDPPARIDLTPPPRCR